MGKSKQDKAFASIMLEMNEAMAEGLKDEKWRENVPDGAIFKVWLFPLFTTLYRAALREIFDAGVRFGSE